MKKGLFIRGIVFGITILFLGLAIQPSVGVQPNNSDNVDDDCDICHSVKVKFTAMNDPICVIIFLITFLLGMRGALMGTIYNLLSLMPFNTLFTIYQKYASIRSSQFLYILDEILNPLYWKYECDYWPYQINIDR